VTVHEMPANGISGKECTRFDQMAGTSEGRAGWRPFTRLITHTKTLTERGFQGLYTEVRVARLYRCRPGAAVRLHGIVVRVGF